LIYTAYPVAPPVGAVQLVKSKVVVVSVPNTAVVACAVGAAHTGAKTKESKTELNPEA
jgi:hypothetical protein